MLHFPITSSNGLSASQRLNCFSSVPTLRACLQASLLHSSVRGSRLGSSLLAVRSLVYLPGSRAPRVYRAFSYFTVLFELCLSKSYLSLKLLLRGRALPHSSLRRSGSAELRQHRELSSMLPNPPDHIHAFTAFVINLVSVLVLLRLLWDDAKFVVLDVVVEQR